MGQRPEGNATIRNPVNREGRGGQPTTWRKNVQKHKRPLPQQVHLNQRLARCQTPNDVFEALRGAKQKNIELNSVNIATALHRVAKTANQAHLPQIRRTPEYQELLTTADSALGDPSNDFNPREMANTAWGLAKAQVADDIGLWEHVADAIARRGLSRHKPQEIANTAWAFATVYNLMAGRDKGKYLPTALGLLEVVRTEMEARERAGTLCEFKPQELSNTLWSFATVGKEAPKVFAGVAEEIKRRGLSEFGPQDIANSIWAFVTAGQSDPELMDCVDKEVMKKGLANFNRQELANLVWAFAKAEHPMDRFLQQVEEEVVARQLWVFRPQELSNLVWAFATAGRQAPTMFQAIEEEIVGRDLGTFKSQEFANIAWAFAKTGRKAEALFASMETELLQQRNLSLFIPQELSNTLWSFAKLGHGSTTLFNAVASEMMRRGLVNFKTQELSNAVWAHASTGQSSEGLFEAVEAEALRRGLEAFSAQDLANMVWAFGKADFVVGEQLLVRLREEFERTRQSGHGMQFKAQELSNLLWACAKMQHIAKSLFNSAEAKVRDVVQHQQLRSKSDDSRDPSEAEGGAIAPLEVPDEMRCYAQVGQQAEAMFTTVEEELLRRDLDEFETQHLANMAWAFVFLKFSRFHRLSKSGLRLLEAVLDAADRRLHLFSIEELRQLGQVVMASRTKEDGPERGFALRVKEAMKAAYDSQSLLEPDSSEFHLEVAHMLKLLGVPHHNEVKVFEGVYHIDIVVGHGDPQDSRGKIAVEVDGPSHFVAGTEEINPHTALKRWLLAREGYKVLSIPFFDWGSLQGGAVCTAYMAYQLEDVGWNLETMSLDPLPAEE